MLRQFSVQNYKGFDQRVTFDFSGREYSFNDHLVKDGLVNKAILYGKNGIGKSSIGIALFDITLHLTDNERMPAGYLANYRNLRHVSQPVCFAYDFVFDGDHVHYEYRKFDADHLLQEQLCINEQVMVDYDYADADHHIVATELAGNLNIDLPDNKLSVLKYIYRNTPSNENTPFYKMMHFCENMLWYRSLSDGNVYSGFTNGGALLTQAIYEQDQLHAFEGFLHDNDVDYSLRFEMVNGTPQLFAYYIDEESGVENKALFTSIASTGTMALLLFYYWKITALAEVSFLFIDEFDAFLHYEAAENVVRMLNSQTAYQTVLTTHNTNLISNKITRPDCCYIMTHNKITSFANATDRELREGHNLEKLYISGEFNA